MDSRDPEETWTLALPVDLQRGLAVAARDAAPLEACGTLVGRRRASRVRVERVVAARNVDPRPATRYTVAPEDLLAAERAACDENLEVVGFWHSHPASEARPSATDRAAAWEGYRYLIVSLADPSEPVIRCWRLCESRMVEDRIEEVD